VANPIPATAEIPASEIAPVVEKAVAESVRQNITGKNLTPFLLAKLNDVTGGRSLKANIALVNHNAGVAAQIAIAFANNKE
jgi:pseudouridine-5'-phosphate glycosidase